MARYYPLPGVEGLVATDPRMVAAMELIAEPILKNAQATAPVQEGDYIEGLKIERGIEGRRAVARVVASNFKSNWIEYGTVKWRAHATLRRAVDAAGLRLSSPGKK